MFLANVSRNVINELTPLTDNRPGASWPVMDYAQSAYEFSGGQF